MKRLVCIPFLIASLSAFAQSTNTTLNEDYYHWIDRYEVKAGKVMPQLFTSVKPYKRKAVVEWIDSLNKKEGMFSSQADQFNYQYLRNDSWEWSQAETNNSKKPVLKNFYKKKSDLAFVDRPEFDLHVSPVLYVGMGKDSRTSDLIYVNTRGVEVRGMIDRKIGFYTYLADNQSLLPAYVRDQITLTGVVPHEGFWKGFKTNGVDFLQARAYIDFNISKHVYLQMGHDRTFIGNGYRSLIFSDYSSPSLFFRTNVKVWKINYLFQINRMTADNKGYSGSGSRYPEKYMAFHHASINLGKKLNIGFFESVIFSPKDPANNNTFEWNYVNPVIFFRAIEQQNGSSDNVILGGDFKWNILKGVSLYGQAVIDEFVLKELKAGTGWWANKFALQGGLKYIDVLGVSNLDLQLEANVVRPYTYSHTNLYSNYSNYRQSLAHPMGANFEEVVAIVRYQPIAKLNLVAKSFFIKTGRDGANQNWGGDILKSYTTRQQDFNNKIGQGDKNNIAFVDLTASFMLRHNLFIDAKQIIRKSTSTNSFYNNNSIVTSLALRWNIPQRTYDF